MKKRVRKLKKKYYLYLSRYHYNSMQECHLKDNLIGAIGHTQRLIIAEEKYLALGGKPEDIYGGGHEIGR